MFYIILFVLFTSLTIFPQDVNGIVSEPVAYAVVTDGNEGC